jgi:L-asparaginase II
MHLVAPQHVPLVVSTRGGMAEIVHYGSIAVAGENGALVASAGDPHGINFTRSVLKPLQVVPLLQDGGMARFGFGSHELAVMCGSHSGEALHVDTVAAILARAGASEVDLACGGQVPSYFAVTRTPAPPRRWGAMFHNCSGKHAGFLAYQRLHGQALRDYLDAAAPLHQRIRALLHDYAGGSEPVVGIDGCSAPNFAIPLFGIARLYRDLARGASAELAAAAFAMRRHPDLVSGTARGDLVLAQAGGGDWIAKVGADGVQAIGLVSRGAGLVIRIADGNARALMLATVSALDQLGVISAAQRAALGQYLRPRLRNSAGLEVGHMQAVFTLPRLFA